MEMTLKAKLGFSQWDGLLSEMAQQLSRARRKLAVDLGVKKQKKLSELKKEYQRSEGITSRQFNSLAFEVKGMLSSYKKNKLRLMRNKEKKRKNYQKKLEETTSAFKAHQFQRKIQILDHQLEQDQKEVDSPRICFGGKTLWKKQFYLKENGYTRHVEWKKDWEAARNSSFFLIGSKDESFGNQSCQLLGNHLQLRLTHLLSEKYGFETIQIPIQWTYQEDLLKIALSQSQALSYRFLREEKGWYVHVSFDVEAAERVTNRNYGALGIDLNPECIAVSEIDSFGNLLHSWQIPVHFRGRRKTQVQAELSDVIWRLVNYARHRKIPIVIEELNFEEKKQELRSRKMNRMLSQFAYSSFEKIMTSSCAKAGVELIPENPAYTSIIGREKFSSGYGLSVHQAAAMAIARRGLRFGERLRRKTQVRAARPVRNRARHVWSDWGRLNQQAKRKKGVRKRASSPWRRPCPEHPPGDVESSSRPRNRSPRPNTRSQCGLESQAMKSIS